jgi:hypothetical protein
MPKRWSAVALAAIAAALIIGPAQPVQAAPPADGPGSTRADAARRLPPGWTIAGRPDRPVLTWQAPQIVPMGDATVEFHADDRLLGRPRQAADLRSFRLDVTPRQAATLSRPEVRVAGRRIDAPAVAQRALPGGSAPAVPGSRATDPANPVDPGVTGAHPTTTGEYAVDPVQLPGLAQPVEVRGVVVAPTGTSGRRPLVLLLHGRHFTCFAGADPQRVSGHWPCPAGTEPVPSHRGYLQTQQLLASQGYVTVSISANGINGQDFLAEDGGAQARSSLVRLHLARWADWAGAQRSTAPEAVRRAPPADMSRVLLFGHSRGGEGVNRAAMDSLSAPPADQDGYHGKVRWTVRATVLVGPTLRGHNPVPDVPSVTILPGCDGDVSDLQGQVYVDGTRAVSRGAALHAALYVVGANHNFFNTEWTPGQAAAPAYDDAGTSTDPVCMVGRGPTRLTAAQQQNVGATYTAAAARLFLAGDDAVRALLDGSGTRAPSADPARVLSHAIGAGRDQLLVPAQTTRVSGGGRLCAEVTPDPSAACLAVGRFGRQSPHFLPFAPGPDPDRYAVAMNWTAAGRPSVVEPAQAVSVKRSTALALRIVVPQNSTGTSMDVSITDAAGRRADLGAVTVDGLPGNGFTTALWAQEVRVPLAAAGGLDLGHVAKLELTPRSTTGQAWLIDAWGWRAGTPATRAVALPRVDVGHLTVDEGDAGPRTVQIPVRVSGQGAGQVRLFLTDRDTYLTTTTVATLQPSTVTVDVPVTVTGNRGHGYDRGYALQVKAMTGAVVGSYDGGLLVRDDDPLPSVTVSPVAAHATEGSALRWQVTPSAVPDRFVYVSLPVQAPATGTELSTTDVDPTWLRNLTGQEATPARPLSSLTMQLFVQIPPGAAGVEVTLPTISDGETEPEETVQLQAMVTSDFTTVVPGPVTTGTVVDAP